MFIPVKKNGLPSRTSWVPSLSTNPVGTVAASVVSTSVLSRPQADEVSVPSRTSTDNQRRWGPAFRWIERRGRYTGNSSEFSTWTSGSGGRVDRQGDVASRGHRQGEGQQREEQIGGAAHGDVRV